MSRKTNVGDVPRAYPRRIPPAVPALFCLVHNNVRPARRQGTRGFRYWLQAPADAIEPCACGWAPELERHYRAILAHERTP